MEGQKTSRDKFAELDGPFAPPSIPAWAGANARIDQSRTPHRRARLPSSDKGYFFPDPGLFFGAEREWKPAAYFMQWEHIKNIWLIRAFSKFARPCTPQEWRDILSLGLLSATSPETTIYTSQAVEHVRSLIGECLTAPGISVQALSKPLRKDQLQELRFDARRGQVLIWELCELNFRWELQALDRRLSKDVTRRLHRQELLMRCFAVRHNCITSIHSPLAASGLAAKTFRERHPFLQAFWGLMNDWPLAKPSTWFDRPLSPVECPASDRWERDLVTFYVQTFYDHFGRPAVLPRTLVE